MSKTAIGNFLFANISKGTFHKSIQIKDSIWGYVFNKCSQLCSANFATLVGEDIYLILNFNTQSLSEVG